MDILDAQRIASSLTILRVWFEGTSTSQGALEKIENLKDSLETVLEELDKKTRAQIPDVKDLLRGTTESALILQSDTLLDELERIIKESNQQLPDMMDKVIQDSIKRRGNPKQSKESVAIEEQILNKFKTENEALIVKDKHQVALIKTLSVATVGLIFITLMLAVSLVFK